ncbi:hypothetical protein [Flavobacterium fluviatile]|uniref:ORC-CDC6 family AAA ATPase n=1 Tax=Flavobacterium fluviatile TaxID=1862387 RepID=UPI0013D235C9|nr:hypothetical protein [Flavobacterium fluviatile]
MRIDINPFFSRPSETIGADDKFIQLFSPDVLEIFDTNKPLWDIVNIIRSSPGGGKTTLLRLFTPDILLRIKNKQKDEHHLTDIYKKLKLLGIYDEKDNPLLIGTHIPFTNEYSTLEYLKIDEAVKNHLFFSLLNTRIILSILYSLCKIKDLEFPTELDQIIINQNPAMTGYNPLRNISNGKKIYDWCCENEEKICNDIDNISLTDTHEVDKSIELYALHLFDQKNVLLNGSPLKEKILVMLDDVHNLSSNQREVLMKNIIDRRHVNIWVAERLQALSMEEIISEGNIVNRDFVLVNLEQFWSKGTKFQKFASSVAEKRLSTIAEGESTNLSSYLSEIIDKDYNDDAKKHIETIKNRINSNFNRRKYSKWIETREKYEGSEIETLVEWKRLEILIYRDHGKDQQLLQFDDFLDEDDLESKDDSEIENGAKLFLHEEFKLPYYYGFQKISRLSSSNIEQFLNISGKLFEAISTNQLKKISQNKSQPVSISPKKQDQLIKKLTAEKWKELDIRVPSAVQIKIFLDNIGDFCREETFKPNAWNSPGINAIAITMYDRAILKDKAINDVNHPMHQLAKCIAICVAYNLLDFRLNYKQGSPGNELMVIYLNRIYCAKYNLPLNNGKFKSRKLVDLKQFLFRGSDHKNNTLDL